ncbi:protein kinase domain-containing protein [Cuspidothrix issatschenkoi]|uniref:non-specific serine/threonine protein kinase n=1 Tax=Cuspidothrix issatschenkoi CHARLIE-1 TaxID=2052836 RepID=A0A2S6CQF0_9CYAN|nr:protein kinase [Cuspidothrix issatschenkoi]PPJ61927.1 serine/threonine protein kinase [Cuspidothrix issatschenkoi CHARLIE-1]
MIGKLLDHRYRVIRILANGGFGQTYIAQDTKRPGNPICMVKHLKPANSDSNFFTTAKRLFHNEAETLEKLSNHDQIPRLLAYFDENQEFFLVQEFIDGHTLSEELIPGQPWSETQVMQMLLDILSILEFVHEEGVIHRDIKPDNIIRRASDYKLVLVDFGAVKQLRSSLVTVGGQGTMTVAIGTPGYMPTEQGQGKPRPNSDIYALGIIAIQALTGVPVSQLQEDADTGEINWQHLIPLNPGLVAILSKMVRYHFKERYQTATEALQACRDLMNITPELSQPSRSVQIIYPSPQKMTSGYTQQTMAVSPGNHIRSQPASQISIPQESNKPDLLPLLIGIFLAGGLAALFTNIYPNFKNLTANLTGENNKITNKCLAVVTANSNIRSEPSAINSDNILKTLGTASQFEVTGKRTKRGWVEVKLPSGRLAWAHSDIITNHENWISCLRDKGLAIQIVDDSSFIASRPVPSVPVTPNIETPKPQPSKPPTEDKSKTVAKAREKFESGDLQGAISLLKSTSGNAVSGIKETVNTINQWQSDWAKAEALANDINQAIDNGKWDEVLAYRDHPEKLPNIKYWRDKLEPMFKEAADNVAKQALPQTNKPTPSATPKDGV